MAGNLRELKIIDHRLCKGDGTPYPFKACNNTGGLIEHKYLVIHYTAGPTAKSAINSFCSENGNASAHVVIDRNGEITQLVPFNRVAWHAGISSWDGLTGLNNYSIGIELVNAGRLEKVGDKWRAWFGKLYDPSDIIELIHKNETTVTGWQTYPQEQLEAALELSKLLVQEYHLLDVIGHEDIAPGRKSDPGPAFPMNNFRSTVMGRADDIDVQFITTTELNIRTGPGSEFPKIIETPLPSGTTVEIINSKGSWRFVDVLEKVNDAMDLQGWVHGRYLRRK